jgi:hypothetical protein
MGTSLLQNSLAVVRKDRTGEVDGECKEGTGTGTGKGRMDLIRSEYLSK